MKKITTKLFILAMALFAFQGIKAQSEILFEEHFDEKNLGAFIVEGNNGPAENPIWSWNADYETVTADAYEKIEGNPVENYLVSPQIQLGTGNTLTFDHINKYFNNVNDEIGAFVREVGGSWVQLKFNIVEVKKLTNIGELEVPAEFEDKIVEFGFRYSAINSWTAGIWAVDNVIVKGKNVKDVPTGIQGVTENKTINKGIYDLQGRRLSKPQPGINIINGRKVIIK